MKQVVHEYILYNMKQGHAC